MNLQELSAAIQALASVNPDAQVYIWLDGDRVPLSKTHPIDAFGIADTDGGFIDLQPEQEQIT